MFTNMFNHHDFSPILSPTPLQHPGQKVSAARPLSPIKSPSPWKGSPGLREPLASARPALPGLQECVPQRPFGVSSKQTSGVGDSSQQGGTTHHWGSPVPSEESSHSSQPTWGIYTQSHKQGQPPPTCSQWVFWEW